MKFWKTAATLAVSLIAGMSCLVTATRADDYPSRTIALVVPFPPGGPSDVVARIVAEGMSRVLGQTMIIENVGGAGGTIGTARVAAATPDGYTLLAASMGSHVAAPVLTPGIRYDSAKDFDPIGLTADAPVAVVARKDFPAKDLKEFIAYVKEHGDSVKQAHGGTGPALGDLIGDHVDFFCEQVVSVAPAVKGKSIKAYVVSGNARSAALPDVPSAKEAGDPEYQLSIWSAMLAPKGTPKDVLAKLIGALDKALDDPAVAKRLADLGGTVPAKAARGPAHFEEVLKADIARWQPVLKAAAPEAK